MKDDDEGGREAGKDETDDLHLLRIDLLEMTLNAKRKRNFERVFDCSRSFDDLAPSAADADDSRTRNDVA